MPDIILHHYPNSPFAEKARLILGLKELEWKSVHIPVMLPKPKLMPLTGGYRRTPVMQIGADIYCDTALIADVLEKIAPTPTLYPKQIEGLARTLAQWADSSLFWAMIPYCLQPAAVSDILGDMTPEQMKAFAGDRAAMRGNAPRMGLAEATATFTDYLQRIDNMLADGRAYLLGAQASIADFSVYHNIWFLQRAKSVASILDGTSHIVAWASRIAAIGHHRSTPMSEDEALAIARDSTALPSAEAPLFAVPGIERGQRVSITPTDYALDPVEGDLLVADAREFALRREDPEVGTVIVHFPRIGFQIKKI